MNFSLAVRISAIFVTFFVSILGFAIPLYFSPKNSNDSDAVKSLKDDWIRILRCFAAGTMLGVGLMHLLAEGVESLASQCTTYPALGYVIATIGTMLVLGMEEAASAAIKSFVPEVTSPNTGTDEHAHKTDADERVLESGIQDQGSLVELPVVGMNRDSHCVLGANCEHSHFYKVNLIANMDVRSNVLKAYILEFAVAIHSILLGVSLGSQADANIGALRALYIAIALHQFVEGVSLGAIVNSVDLSMTKVTVFVVTFGLAVSIGVVIGILVTEFGPQTEDGSPHPAEEYATGVINSLCAGIMVYVALVELAAEDFQASKIADRFLLKSKMFVSLMLGAAGMAILAIWA
jgi:zinc transporter 1/2/3